jgi:two-component system chemotaxis sensor kinase CheA
MKVDLKRFHETFFEEAFEHLATMESGLLELETRGADAELLNNIFRAAHSIKGGSGSFGFTEIARLTHVLENVLDRLRGGRIAVEPALTALLLKATDLLRDLVEATRCELAGTVPIDETVAELEGTLSEPLAATGPVAARTSAGAGVGAVCEVHFRPHGGFFRQGQDVFLLLREVAELGEVLEVSCDRSRLPVLEALDPEVCHLSWVYRLRGVASEAAIRDVFMFVEDACDLTIRTVTETSASASVAVPSAGVTPSAGALGPKRQPDASSIRVPTEKVDALINLVGELVIAQAMVSQVATGMTGEGLIQIQEALGMVVRSTRDLQERVMSIRMLPVGSVFNRFPRTVHDLALSLGKRVRLEISGADTELDKSVIERLGDPLTHLIRNSVDHGVELPEERVRCGKPEEGVVRLRAFHEGGNVVIEIADDGKGLDRQRIREKAVAQGLVRADAVLSDEDIHALLFRAGFSTATVVTDVSGRGVGMDVVKRNVDALNGAIVVSSVPGQGSRFRIRLPLTLAILDGLSIQVGREVFIIPLLAIAQSVRPAPGAIKTVLGGRGEIFMLRGEQVPLLRLDRLLGIAAAVTDPYQGIVVVLESDGCRFGVLVDDVLGQSQVVIKSLEQNYRKVDAVMGATIMGDGRVALIMDVVELHRIATRRQDETEAPAAETGAKAGTEAGAEAEVSTSAH